MPTASTRHPARRPRARRRATVAYADFLDDLTTDRCWASDEAERAACVVIATLGELVSVEARALTVELPPELCAELGEAPARKPNPKMSTDEFLRRVAMRLGEEPEEVEAIVRVVFGAVRRNVSPTLEQVIELQLPDDLRRLWNPPSFGRR